MLCGMALSSHMGQIPQNLSQFQSTAWLVAEAITCVCSGPWFGGKNLMVGTFQATAGFQDSDIFQKAIKMVFRCVLSVISHLSGFKL